MSGLLLTGLAPLLTTPVRAQDTNLDREVEFVRKLAKEMNFTSLARAESDRLQAAHRDSGDFKKIFQLGVEISLIGARSHPNREERRTLFKDALERSKEFIDRYSDDPVANRARRTLIEACYEYGAYLLDEIDLARDENPDQVAELEAQAQSVYKDGIAAARSVMDSLEGGKSQDGSEAQRDYYVTWLFRAMLEREQARAAAAQDREAFADLARETFEEFIFEVGEETLLGLRGWFEMSKIGEVLGDYTVAFDDYQATIESIRKSLDDAAELGLDRGSQEYLFNLLQEASDRAAAALFAQGKIDETLAFVETFKQDLAKYGEEGEEPFAIAHPTYGHPVFLTEARAQSESGDAEKVAAALAMARKINDAHPNDIIGLRAKNVLAEILEIQSELVSGALLFEIAKGDLQEREHEKAIEGFKRAYGAMTAEEKKSLGLETWTSIARSFGILDRNLEATLAATIGLERHGADGGATEATADILERAWAFYQRDSKNSEVPALAPLKDRVMAALLEHGGAGSEAKQRWKDAERKLAENAPAEAAALYALVPKDTTYYEAAQARVVVAWQSAGDHQQARAAAESYLEWLKTPEAEIPADRVDLLSVRKQALATIDFYGAYMDFLEAVGRVGGAPDPTRFEPTIARLRRFITERGKDGESYVTSAWEMIARLQAQLGQLDRAEESYRTLRNLAPNSPQVAVLGTVLFAAHFDHVKALTTERDALIAKEAPAAEVTEVSNRLEQARRAAIASGVDYMENAASSPQFGVLFSTLQLAGDARDWKTAERVGRRIVELFGKDPERAKTVEEHVTARLGEALLRQQKFKDAVAILETAAAANPNNYPVKRFLSLAQGGWYAFDEFGQLKEITGADEPAAAYQRHWTEYQKYLKARGVERYTLEWYEFINECFMFAARAAKQDSSFEDTRQKLFKMAESIDDFAGLRKLGPEGERLYQIFVTVR